MGIEKEIAPVLAVALITWGGVFFYILRLDRLRSRWSAMWKSRSRTNPKWKRFFNSMLLPVSLNLKNRRCLVVGGGAVAERKVRSLLECEAQVHVVSPELCDELKKATAHTSINRNRAFKDEDCRTAFLFVPAQFARR
jgi:hypothetical protein